MINITKISENVSKPETGDMDFRGALSSLINWIGDGDRCRPEYRAELTPAENNLCDAVETITRALKIAEAVTGEPTEKMRRSIWESQYRHINETENLNFSDFLVKTCADKRINSKAQHDRDRVAWKAMRDELLRGIE